MNIENINLLRKKAGLSIDELAQKADLPKSTVEKILFGVVKHPRIDTVQAIEKALGLEAPAWTEDDYAEGVRKTKNVTVTAEEEELLSLYKEIGQKKGAGAQALARKILEQVLNN